MDGLEALLFGVFIVFVLINLLIRFFVRKVKRQKQEIATPAQEISEGESELEGEKPWLPSQDFEVVAPEIEPAYTREEVGSLESKIETMAESKTVLESSPALESIITPSLESWGKERIEKLEGTIEVKTVIEDVTVSFWERIEKLTMLQRAVVLSEVLGPPKGLQ